MWHSDIKTQFSSMDVSIFIRNECEKLQTNVHRRVSDAQGTSLILSVGLLEGTKADSECIAFSVTMTMKVENEQCLNFSECGSATAGNFLWEIRLDPFIAACHGNTVQLSIRLKSENELKRVQVPRPVTIFTRTLIVENMRFPVCAEALALNSHFFETLFFGPFKEGSETEIKIGGISSEDFNELHCVLAKGDPVTADNCLRLLENADRFDLRFVTDRCEDFLMCIGGIPGGEKVIVKGSRNELVEMIEVFEFAQYWRLYRFMRLMSSRLSTGEVALSCLEALIPSDLIHSLSSRIRIAPMRTRVKVFIDVSETSDSWSERVYFSLFSDLCPIIVSRLVSFFKGTFVDENNSVRTLRGSHLAAMRRESGAMTIMAYTDRNTDTLPLKLIPSGCEERNQLAPHRGCLYLSTRQSPIDSHIPLDECFWMYLGIGSPSSPNAVVVGSIEDNVEALDYVAENCQRNNFMIGESAVVNEDD